MSTEAKKQNFDEPHKDCADCTEALRLEHGLKAFWRPIAAYVYLFICLFDFVVAPALIEYENAQVNVEAFEQIRQLESVEVKTKALEQLELGSHQWTPLTLTGGGLFHMAFGAILGISAFTRGQEKTAAIQAQRLQQ